MKKRIFVMALAASLVVLPGCKKKEAEMGQMPPPAVSVAQPERRDIIEWDEYTGRLEAKESVEIRARVNGWLDKMHFVEGKDVKAGDLLFTIDPRPYKAAVERAQADYDRAQSREAQAKNELDRVRGLVATKAVSEEIFDTREKAYAEAKSALRSAKAALDVAKLDVEFTEVRSPIDGKISRAMVTKGNLVAASTLLTTVVSTSPIYLYVDVDEAASLRYRRLFAEGKQAATDSKVRCQMALGDEEGWPHEGFIDFVDNRVDPATGTIRARGVFEPKGRELAPGFFARLRLPGSEKYTALFVPDSCIGSDQAMKYVLVVDEKGLAQRRQVKLGPLDGTNRIIREGLKGDERVIVNGQARVFGTNVPVAIEPAPTKPVASIK